MNESASTDDGSRIVIRWARKGGMEVAAEEGVNRRHFRVGGINASTYRWGVLSAPRGTYPHTFTSHSKRRTETRRMHCNVLLVQRR